MSEPHKFLPGNVVQAILDGRAMTVYTYDAQGNVVCRWFDREKHLQQATFPEAVLKRVDES